jgi:hypothetical protein
MAYLAALISIVAAFFALTQGVNATTQVSPDSDVLGKIFKFNHEGMPCLQVWSMQGVGLSCDWSRYRGGV